MSDDVVDHQALARRYAKLIHELCLLPEGASAALTPYTSHGKAESRQPAGTRLGRSTVNGPYDPNHDPLLLYVEWLWETATSDRDRLAAVVEGEVRLKQWRKPQLGMVAGGTLDGDKVVLTPDDIKVRDARIIERYDGLPALEASIVESTYGYCPESNIRVVRARAGRDPENGVVVEDDRAIALRLHAEQMSLGNIAKAIGKPKSTVQGWVERARKAAA